ncbi:uncharacterized protein LOC111091657 isoform X2 [Canis lupus familiaris]|uniref:uncharacterized protein LOC111091657 isoform X2 n=1 Tax=Canis lupus familiaris TaxID=9615 RepID=UPI0018F2F06E|nr:uncharacterized protein LOC111091657 isoform X2 [Canis lupus familiaris]XP_038312818.1 uncharacterized protein LOC111091657 isoform X2 [Canis lupus familiaris]XP_038425718.1 uncharacterized protein LOC111091657 isoform X2 [Canis lupus familiaris]
MRDRERQRSRQKEKQAPGGDCDAQPLSHPAMVMDLWEMVGQTRITVWSHGPGFCDLPQLQEHSEVICFERPWMCSKGFVPFAILTEKKREPREEGQRERERENPKQMPGSAQQPTYHLQLKSRACYSTYCATRRPRYTHVSCGAISQLPFGLVLFLPCPL